MKAQKLNRRQARWALYLSRFDFTLKHVAGSKMGKADGLSRRVDWKVGMDKDNENQIFIKDQWICNMYEVVVEGELGWQKQKEEEAKEETGKKQKEKEEKRKRKQKREKMMEVKKVAEKWEIWDEEKEAAKSEAEAKKLVPEKFHK